MTGGINMNTNSITSATNISTTGIIQGGVVRVVGGLSTQYMLADGSLLTQSANSGNSNVYTSNNINNSFDPPISSGDGNTHIALATFVFISHITRDGVDIEVFLVIYLHEIFYIYKINQIVLIL